MKHQQVGVDFWAMGKALLMYGGLTIMGWIMMRLFNTAFALPGRMRAQQEHIQNTLVELQRRFPDLNITEEDLKNAEQELENFIKEDDKKEEKVDSENAAEKEVTSLEKDKSESDGAEKIESKSTGENVKEAEHSTPMKLADKKTN